MVNPTWNDIDVVMERMQARGLLRHRAPPGKIYAHILCIAAFARSQRRADYYGLAEWDGMQQFVYDYCESKRLNVSTFLDDIKSVVKEEYFFDRDALEMLEVLSKP